MEGSGLGYISMSINRRLRGLLASVNEVDVPRPSLQASHSKISGKKAVMYAG